MIIKAKLKEEDKYWDVSVGGRIVTGLYIDYGFTIDLYQKDDTVSIRLSTEFEFSEQNGIRIIRSGNMEEIAKILKIFNKIVNKLYAYKNGDLWLEFEDESFIKVSSSRDNEAWSVTSDGGIKIFALPGNAGLEIYSP